MNVGWISEALSDIEEAEDIEEADDTMMVVHVERDGVCTERDGVCTP